MIILIKLFILLSVWSSFFYASGVWLMAATMGRANPLLVFGIPLVFLMFGLGLTYIIYNFQNYIVLYIIFLLILVNVIANVITKKKRQREIDKHNEENRKRWLRKKPAIEKKLKDLEERLKKGDKKVSSVEIRKLKSDLEYINNIKV